MNEHHDEKLQALLKRAMPPLAGTELKRDLWPDLLRRLDERSDRVFGPISWWDWALVALVAAWVFLFPEVIPGLLYHL